MVILARTSANPASPPDCGPIAAQPVNPASATSNTIERIRCSPLCMSFITSLLHLGLPADPALRIGLAQQPQPGRQRRLGCGPRLQPGVDAHGLPGPPAGI